MKQASLQNIKKCGLNRGDPLGGAFSDISRVEGMPQKLEASSN